MSRAVRHPTPTDVPITDPATSYMVNPSEGWRFRWPEGHHCLQWETQFHSGGVECHSCRLNGGQRKYTIEDIVDGKTGGTLADHFEGFA